MCLHEERKISHNFQYRDLNIILLRLWKYINYARSHGGTLETVEANPPNLELVHTLSHKASHLKINWRLEICKFFFTHKYEKRLKSQVDSTSFCEMTIAPNCVFLTLRLR